MQYAERLPNTRTLLAPVVALAIGAAAATGAYALIDSETVVVGDPEVIVAEVPAPGTVAKTHNEAVAAAAISATAPGAQGGTDEAATAAAISPPATSQGGTDEAATAAAITPPESAPANGLDAPGPQTN